MNARTIGLITAGALTVAGIGVVSALDASQHPSGQSRPWQNTSQKSGSAGAAAPQSHGFGGAQGSTGGS